MTSFPFLAKRHTGGVTTLCVTPLRVSGRGVVTGTERVKGDVIPTVVVVWRNALRIPMQNLLFASMGATSSCAQTERETHTV